MKRRLKTAVTLCVIIMSIFSICFVGCTDGEIIDLENGEKTLYIDSSTKNIAECTPNESLFALAYNVKNLYSYEVTLSGTVDASLTTQIVEGAKYKAGDCALYVSRSTSTFKNTANKIFIKGDTVLFRNGNAKTQVYDDECAKYSYGDYIKEYGTDFRDISDYALNEETVLSAELVSAENGVYTFKYEINVEKGVNGYRVNMKKIGDLGDYPTFTKSTLLVSMTKDFMPISIVQTDEYKVKMIFSVSCTSCLTATYGRINDKTVAIPEYDFYISKLGD